MPFQKIAILLPNNELPKLPIKYGDDICWHFASFNDLMTKNSTMMATPFVTGLQAGRAGTGGHGLLEQIYRVDYSLGEMSIWEEKDIVQ